jgi:hypothetical protein
MNEVFEPKVESFRKTVSQLGTQTKENLTAQVKREPAKTLTIVLAGSVLVSLAIGYSISRMEQASRRQRFVEDGIREVTNWIRQNGWKMATPLQGGVDAAKSAVADVSNSTARRWLPFFEKQKRSFLNLF